MAFGVNTLSFGAGAVEDLFKGQATSGALKLKAQGDEAEAGNYDLAAELARQNSEFTKVSTGIKETQEQRQIYLGLGTTKADIGAAGFTESGSAIDLLRDSAAQGALTKAVIGEQGLITEAGYDEQSQAYTNMASIARSTAAGERDLAHQATRNSYITAGIKGAAALATLFI